MATWSLEMTPARERLTQASLVGLLAVTHLLTDAVTNTLPALLPMVQARLGLAEMAVAGLITTLTLSSSVAQPWFGAVADRVGRRRVVALGVILNVTVLSLAGAVSSLVALHVLLLLGGLGSAAMHPAGASLARQARTSRRELAVSVFGLGGTLGVALGPLFVLLAAQWLGLGAWLGLLLPGLLLGGVIGLWFPERRPMTEASPMSARRSVDQAWQLLAGPVGHLAAVQVLAGLASQTFLGAVPLWLVRVRGLAPEAPALAWTLALFSFSGALGGVAASLLSRRLPAHLLVPGSMLLGLPLLLAFLLLRPEGVAFFVVVGLAGALVQAGLPVLIVRAQALAPRNVAAASGIVMGFATGIASLLYLGLGWVQQSYGLTPALSLGFVGLIPGAAIAFWALGRPGGQSPTHRAVPVSGQEPACAACPA